MSCRIESEEVTGPGLVKLLEFDGCGRLSRGWVLWWGRIGKPILKLKFDRVARCLNHRYSS